MTDYTLSASDKPARVIIEGARGPLEVAAYVDDTNRWNGFVTPFLDAAAVDALAAHFDADPDDPTIVRDGARVVVVDPLDPSEPYDAPTATAPDGSALWCFDFGWGFTLPGEPR